MPHNVVFHAFEAGGLALITTPSIRRLRKCQRMKNDSRKLGHELPGQVWYVDLQAILFGPLRAVWNAPDHNKTTVIRFSTLALSKQSAT